MQCQDNSKLRIPLDEVCETTDIGCVPATKGQPDCSPQPDELPIAYDKSASTLWLFDCSTRTWIAHKKFSMDQLQDLNLDNITNICNLLKIGVYYNPGSGNIQGTITLQEFTEKLLKCLELQTNVLTITQGDSNTISINVEGLDNLPPFYIKGDNVTFTGSGTQTDPLVAHVADPICKWPTKTPEQVKAADTKHVGMCVDGESVRVPFTENLFQEPVCKLPQKTDAQMKNASDKNLIACVDGEAAKVPYPPILEQKPVCEADQLTAAQAQAAGTDLQVVGCKAGELVRIPVPGSFFEPEFLCVPTVTGRPSGAPQYGTSPLRVGCNGELYVWLCESDGSGRWEEIRYNFNSLSNLNVNNVTDLCNNFRLMGWYSDTTGDPCVREVKLTLQMLGDALKECNACCDTVAAPLRITTGNGLCYSIRVKNTINIHGDNYVIYSLRDGNFIYGSSGIVGETFNAGTEDEFVSSLVRSHLKLTITNPFLSKKSLLIVDSIVQAYNPYGYENLSTYYVQLTENFNIADPFSSSERVYSGEPGLVIYSPNSGSTYPFSPTNGVVPTARYHISKINGPRYYKILEPGEKVEIYGFLWIVQKIDPGNVFFAHMRMGAQWRIHNGVAFQ